MVLYKKLLLALLALIGIPLLIVFLEVLAFMCLATSTVMTKRSPDGLQSAQLTRTDCIDRNFAVYVNGRRVYWSPDFVPGRGDPRAQIVWSTDSKRVVMIVAEQRLFGFDVAENRRLSDLELAQVKFPTLRDLGYEGHE